MARAAGSPSNLVDLVGSDASDDEGAGGLSQSGDDFEFDDSVRADNEDEDRGGNVAGIKEGGAETARPHVNELLPPSEVIALASTTVDRREWIPGYRTCRSFTATDIRPWHPSVVDILTVKTLSAADLRDITPPQGWLFLNRSPAPENLRFGDPTW